MPNVLILNGHHPYAFSPGGLNAALVERARAFFEVRGDAVRVVETAAAYETETEIANHQWADIIVMQFPVNWMGVPWSFKKYQDDVYTAGMDGRLCAGDGRSADMPKANYGTGGTLTGKRYMLSVTFNAPREAFDAAGEYLFQGRSVDDLLLPLHMNARFFGLQKCRTFAAFDVMKNPEIEQDFARFDALLAESFAMEADHVAA